MACATQALFTGRLSQAGSLISFRSAQGPGTELEKGTNIRKWFRLEGLSFFFMCGVTEGKFSRAAFWWEGGGIVGTHLTSKSQNS